MAKYKIWVAGIPFDIDHPTVTFKDSVLWDSTQQRCVRVPERCGLGKYAWNPYKKDGKLRQRRYSFRRGLPRNHHPPLSAVQALVRMFTIHHDGCADANMCFKVLHDERGLSVHFIIDNDGTIYQTLDLGLMGFQAAGFNQHSIGVELCNRGDAKRFPDYYTKSKQSQRGPVQGRAPVTCQIHGHTYLAYSFRDPQVEALKELARALRFALPNLPIEYPQELPGHQAWGMIDNPRRFSGYMGHYHQTTRKWDPGPFDFKSFCEDIRGSLCFPVYTGKLSGPKRPPEIPTDSDDLDAQIKKLYALNEARAPGGYYPVGPWGQRRLWHGGVHLQLKAGSPVFAPFAGVVVAARNGPNTSIGSTNFVLLRHDLTVGQHSIRFFSLYYHLKYEKAPDKVEWRKGQAEAQDTRGKLSPLAVPVRPGTRLGRVGSAGPPDLREAQIHFEIFARDKVVDKLEATGIASHGLWKFTDGTAGGRFSEDREINALFDSDGDGDTSADELRDYFRRSASTLHYQSILHQSEWAGSRDSWLGQLRAAPEFDDLSPEDIEQYVDDQIAPTLWWDAIRKHAKLPRDGIVYHFHPITFISYVNRKLLEAGGDDEKGVGAAPVSEARATPAGVMDDRDDTEGVSFVDASELELESDPDDYPLERLVHGFEVDDDD